MARPSRYADLLALLAAFPPAEGWLEFRARRPNDRDGMRRTFIAPDDTEGIVRWLANRGGYTHAFMSVARRDGQGGSKSHLVSLPALWVDIDRPEPGAWPEHVPAPTAIVASGRGRHVYWALEQAIALDAGRVRYVDAVLRGLAKLVGGDRSSAEASHLLRAPGTLNAKYTPPVRARLIELHGERRIPFHRFVPFAASLDESALFVPPPYQPLPPDDAVARILGGCRFLQWAARAAADVSEPLWHAALTNLAPFPGGLEAARSLSERHPHFSPRELQQKFRHAQAHSRPHTCRRIASLGFSGCSACGWHGVVRSPAAIALKRPRTT